MALLNGILIGHGNIGRHHLRVLKSKSQACVLGVVDSMQPQLDGVVVWKDLDQCFADLAQKNLNIDFAVVATPIETHFELASMLLEKNIHVLLEKPMAESSAKAHALVALAKQHNRVLFIGHSERFNPAYQVFMEQFANGITGQVYRIEINRTGPFPLQAVRAGATIDLAVHDLEIVTRVLKNARPAWVFARNEQRVHHTHEDGVNAMMGYGPDVLVQLTVNWLSPRKNRYMNVFGHQGMLQCDFYLQKVVFFENLYKRSKPDEYGIGGIEVGAETVFDVPKWEPLSHEHDAFLHCVSNGLNDAQSLESASIAVELANQIVHASSSLQPIYLEVSP